jgi:fumarate hydratase subunit beta
MGEIRITTPLSDDVISRLRSGDRALIDGTLFTARDAAHKRLVELIDRGEQLPFDLKGQIVYYVGPTPARPGRPIGSAGPTTSFRMDAYAPRLIEKGLKGMIGKGARSKEVIEAMQRFKCVYFTTVGGAGALIAQRITRSEIVAYEDLGAEAVRKLTVEHFPVFVVNDIHGNDLYREGVQKYARTGC